MVRTAESSAFLDAWRQAAKVKQATPPTDRTCRPNGDAGYAKPCRGDGITARRQYLKEIDIEPFPAEHQFGGVQEESLIAQDINDAEEWCTKKNSRQAHQQQPPKAARPDGRDSILKEVRFPHFGPVRTNVIRAFAPAGMSRETLMCASILGWLPERAFGQSFECKENASQTLSRWQA